MRYLAVWGETVQRAQLVTAVVGSADPEKLAYWAMLVGLSGRAIAMGRLRTPRPKALHGAELDLTLPALAHRFKRQPDHPFQKSRIGRHSRVDDDVRFRHAG